MFFRVCVIVAVLGLAKAISLYNAGMLIEPDSLYPRHRRTSDPLVRPPVLKDGGEPDYNERLLTSLLSNYNDDVKPQNSTTVNFGLSYLCAQFDEQTRLLTSRAWMTMGWTDPRLKWKPESFGGIDILRIPFYRIWHPDIKMYNSLARAEVDYVNAVVSNDGGVWHIPPATFKSACLPSGIDDQSYNCTMKFGSWTYDGFELALETTGLSYENYLDECPYVLQTVSARINTMHYACCTEPYQDFTANFTIAKRP